MNPTRLFIDAGHGGRDHGVVWQNGNRVLKESDICLTLAYLLRLTLQKNSYNPVLLRSRDRYMPELFRIMRINDNRLFSMCAISLHMDADVNSTTRGFQVLFNANEIKSRFIARGIVGNLVSLVDREDILPRKQGIYPGESKFLSKVQIPSVVINLGYITNSSDRDFLSSRGLMLFSDAISSYLLSDSFRGMITE